MKIQGKKLEGIVRRPIPIIRGEDVHYLVAEAITDYSDFDTLCPRPNPPMGVRPGGVPAPNIEDAGFRKQLDEWITKRTNWMILKSLSATEGLEWSDAIDLNDPETWGNYNKEFIEAGLNESERTMIVTAVTIVNTLDQEKIDAAMDDFYRGPEIVVPE